jgi:hypothetical protein
MSLETVFCMICKEGKSAVTERSKIAGLLMANLVRRLDVKFLLLVYSEPRENEL